MGLPVGLSLHNVLAFLEYLYQKGLSPKVIKNYVSSLSSMAKNFGLDHQHLSHQAIFRYLRSIQLNSSFRPTPRRLFDIRTLYHISRACDQLSDLHLYRAIFLTAFYGFLRMSNCAPHAARLFDPSKHFLRQDAIFQPPGVHLILKRTKTMQDHKSYHVLQLPFIENIFLCPVRALQSLLKSRPLQPTAHLFANREPPFSQVIDTHIRDALRFVLRSRNIPTHGHGFHTSRQSGATFAFDNNVSLQNIMSHGLWKSSSVWTYLQNASVAPSIVPTTFARNIPHHL